MDTTTRLPKKFFLPELVSMLAMLLIPRSYLWFISKFGLAYMLWKEDPFNKGPTVLLLEPSDAYRTFLAPGGERNPRARAAFGPLVGDSLPTATGESNLALRRILVEVMSAQAVKRMVPLA